VADPAPKVDVLLHLPTEEWDRLVAAARTAVHADEAGLASPRLRQLAATPPAKMRTGRARRDLATDLAAGGWLWTQTAVELRSYEAGERLLEVIRAGRAPTVPDPGDTRWAADVDRERRWRQREAQLKERGQRLQSERDDAMRRADGLEARLRTALQRAEELENQLGEAGDERHRLARRLEEADEVRERELDRLRRHYDARLQEASEELRTLRRQREERRRALEKNAAAREAATQQARDEIAAFRSSQTQAPAGAVLGRPSRLPPGIAPRTKEAFSALLQPGMRIIIDGYNVTKQHRDGAPLEQQRLWLVKVCDGLAARTAARCTVVFDGAASVGGRASGGRRTRVLFSEQGSADDEIVALVRDLPREEPAVIVTDDRELIDRVSAEGVDTVSTPAFLDLVE
jgi:hypothetical protein